MKNNVGVTAEEETHSEALSPTSKPGVDDQADILIPSLLGKFA